MDDRKGKRELDEEDNLERKRKRHHVARSVARRWTVNASIRETDQSRCYYLVPRLQTASMDCLTAVENHQYVLLSGARAPGKSTRLLWLDKKLKSMNYKAV